MSQRYSGGNTSATAGFNYGTLTPSGHGFHRVRLPDPPARQSRRDCPVAAATRAKSLPAEVSNLPRLGAIPVRSPLLRVSWLLLGRRVLRCFSSPSGSAAQTPRGAGASPRPVPRFGHLGLVGCTRLPPAFRGGPRPSSPCNARGIPRVRSASSSCKVVNDRAGGPRWIRTTALSLIRRALSPLSYGPAPPVLGILNSPCPTLPRKEVIQPHLPIRLPCYDFTPIAPPTVDKPPLAGSGFGCGPLSWCDGRCVQGPGTHSPPHADGRLLAIPASRRRVAACDPNYDAVWGFAPARAVAAHCRRHCSTCVAQAIKAMRI
jgi:hypothetical protein